MSNRTIWVVVGIIIVIIMLVAGFLPLPGQKDNVTPLTEPRTSNPQGMIA